MINLNPLSPITNTPLSDCDNRELDAWAAKLCGYNRVCKNDEDEWVQDNCQQTPIPPFTTAWAAAGPLMDRAVFDGTEITMWKSCQGFHLTVKDKKYSGWSIVANDELHARCNAFIIAAEHAKENHYA